VSEAPACCDFILSSQPTGTAATKPRHRRALDPLIGRWHLQISTLRERDVVTSVIGRRSRQEHDLRTSNNYLQCMDCLSNRCCSHDGFFSKKETMDVGMRY
jgi:hypothetical protein